MTSTLTLTPETRSGVIRILRSRQLLLFILILAWCAVITINQPRFLTVQNLLNVSDQAAILAIPAAVMTLIIISAGIVIVVIRGGIARPLSSLSRGYQDLAAGEQGDEGSAELDKSRYYGQLRDIAESYHTLASRDRAASAGTPR